jgi:hypothetical protein
MWNMTGWHISPTYRTHRVFYIDILLRDGPHFSDLRHTSA